jgi:SNF2 family DNA or RNA helicase
VALPTDRLTLSPTLPVGLLAFRGDVLATIPHAKRIDWKGQPALVIPHRHDEVQVLANLGIAAEAPILTRYDWAGNTPFRAQKITAAMLTTEKCGFVLSEPATGKTRAALFAFDYLKQQGAATSMLVVCPLSTMRDAWQREIVEHLPHLTSCVVHGDAAHRSNLLASDAFDIYIINHDGIRHNFSNLLAVNFDVVCVDELTAFKNASAKRSKAMQKIAAQAPYVWGMTGTPTAQGPEDAHGQVRVVKPENVPASAKRWKDMTCIKMGAFRWVSRPEANALVQAAMSPAVRFKRADVVELPPMQFVRRHAPMSAKQRGVYDTLMKRLLVTLQSGETIKVANAGVLFMKTLQVAACGFVIDNDGIHRSVDPTPRMDLIGDIIEEWDARTKFLVFNPFRHGVELLADHLNKRGLKVAKVDGSTSEKARSEIFDRFRNDPELQGIVAHPRCMSHGLTLVEANMIVWAAPYPSLEIYEQANARISRPGQTKSQLVVQVSGSKVEDAIYKRLDERGNLQRDLLKIVEEGVSPY